MAINELNPETLYQHYKRNRKAVDEIKVRGSSWPQSHDVQPDATLASHVYEKYKITRNSIEETPVDTIMLLIQTEGEASNDATKDMYFSNSSRRYGGEDGKQRFVSVLKNKKKNWLRAKFHSLDKKNTRFLSPAMAAAFFAFCAIPLILYMSHPSGPVSAVDLDHYQAAATFIEQKNAQSLGFSSAVIEEKYAFNVGVLAMQIKVSVLGNNPSKRDFAVHQLAKLIDADDIDSLRANLVAIDKTMSAALHATSSESAKVEATERTVQNLSETRVFLKSTTTGTESYRWYELGEQIQAISLFAQARLELDITDPLNNMISTFNSSDYPQQTLSIKKLLNELKIVSSRNELNSDDLNEIINLCRDIKILMH